MSNNNNHHNNHNNNNNNNNGNINKLSTDFKKINKPKRNSFLSNIFVSHSNSSQNLDTVFDFTNISKSTNSSSPSITGQHGNSISESEEKLENDFIHRKNRFDINEEENMKRREESLEVKGFKDANELFLEKRKKIFDLMKKNSNYIVLYHEDLTNQVSSNLMIEKKNENSSYYDYDRIKIHFKKNNDTENNNNYGPIQLNFTTIKKLKNEIYFKSKDKLNGQKAPSIKHVAISELVKKGIIKHVISASTQGQLKLSGISNENLTEIYGNSFVEGN